MDINLNLYKVFYITSKCNSFVEASEKLCISQPAVSKHIKNLEELLGTKLFYRDKVGLSLTSDGKKLYHHIEKASNILLAGEKMIKESKNIESGTLIIGVPAHIASFYLLEYIEKLQEEHPNIFVRIINGSTSQLLEDLQQHKVDFVIDSSPIKLLNTNLVMTKLLPFETCFITSSPSEKQSLENLRCIMPYERSSIRKNLEKLLKEYDVKLSVILEVETTDLIINSVKNNIGVGYVVKKAVADELENKELFELKTEYKLPTLELNLIYMEDYLTNLANHFITHYILK